MTPDWIANHFSPSVAALLKQLFVFVSTLKGLDTIAKFFFGLVRKRRESVRIDRTPPETESSFRDWQRLLMEVQASGLAQLEAEREQHAWEIQRLERVIQRLETK